MEPQEPQHNLSNLVIEALRAKGLSLARLSEATGVPENILAAILDEKYDKLPAAPYVRGYLMKVAETLGLDGQRLWLEYLHDRKDLRRSGAGDVLPPNRFTISRLNKKVVAIILAVALVFGYIILRLPGFFGSPSLSLGPVPQTVQSPNLTIQGKMNPADQLTLNGEEIYPDKSGNFQKNIVLQPGFNTLTFDIRQLMGQTYAVTRQVFYAAPTGTNAQSGTAAVTSTGPAAATSTIHQ